MAALTLFLESLGLMVVWHALADYPLQGDFLARAKNRFAPVPGIPWQHAMFAHAAIHAGGIWLITGVWWLALLELVSHALIDDVKCDSASRFEGVAMARFAFHADQFAHLAIKVLIAGWVVALA